MKTATIIINGLVGALVCVGLSAYALGARIAPTVPDGLSSKTSALVVADPSAPASTTVLRAAVVGPSGGLMLSTGYSATVTLGEPFIGTTLTSTSYTACVGFQCIGNRVPISSFAWLPIMAKFYPPLCDGFEPNDNRRTVTGGQVSSGVTYSAKLCANDAEDNYLVQKSGAGNISLNITLPVPLRGHTTYFVYATSNFTTPVAGCSGAGSAISAAPFTGTCTVVSAGSYVVRLYTDSPSVFDNNNSYTFSITY